MRDWHPLATRWLQGRPKIGDVLAFKRAAWTVTDVRDADPTDEEREWLASLTSVFRDRNRPYRMTLRHLYGPTHRRQNQFGDLALRCPAGHPCWDFYESGRVPLCSCCGHPWPCRMLDAEVTADREAKTMSDRMGRVMPGCCYGCGEPITSRQKSVRYPEPNVQVPGSPAPTFHMRSKCFWAAHDYERDRARLHPDAPPLATAEHGWVLPDPTLTARADLATTTHDEES
jgi:hypothetical protein